MGVHSLDDLEGEVLGTGDQSCGTSDSTGLVTVGRPYQP
jgi:hypothetical protein